MAQTERSKTSKLANGNHVTVTTGYNRGGYYRKVTVRRPDGTVESRTDRKNIGFLNTGLFNVSGAYSGGVPRWAGGTQRELGFWPFVMGLVLVVLVLGWPFMFHWRKPVEFTAAGTWWAFLLLGLGRVIASRKRRSGPDDSAPGTLQPPPAATQGLPNRSPWPQRFTDSWFLENEQHLSPLETRQLGEELRRRGWSDGEICERAAPQLRFPVI